jgi:hypothetical protein
MKEGFITALTMDCEYVRLDVGPYTSFETLDEGETVAVDSETLGSTDFWIAITVTRNEDALNLVPDGCC